MKRSSDRILTSHVGSLPRPEDLRALFSRNASGDELESALRSAVADVVRKQAEVGIDVVNDGEFGKPMSDEVDYGAWGRYVYDRMSGYEIHEIDGGARIRPGKDQRDFAEFYASGEAPVMQAGRKFKTGVPVAPIKYVGQEQVKRDIENLKAAASESTATDVFISAVSAGTASMRRLDGSIYATPEEEAAAVAEALREEYKIITDAGLNVQLDDPYLVNLYEFNYSISGDMKGFRKWAERHIELVNHSLEGIPEEQVRYHVCWGSWKGPHSSDLPVKEVADLIVKVNAALYSVEAANVQHEHEWKVWRDVKLPDGRTVMPGVVTHKTNVLEHPELVADRIVHYAEAVGRENVIAGTDCGMGGRLHPQLSWAKLQALSQGAELATKQLWG